MPEIGCKRADGIVQALLDKANPSGAVYGKAAFRQGFRDGVIEVLGQRLISW